MLTHNSWTLVQVTIILLWSCRTSYSLLTELPVPIPNMVHVDYSNEAITTIASIEYLSAMKIFTITGNGLVHFPSFINNPQIESIYLRYNAITFVLSEDLDTLVQLQLLDLRDNQLSEFPDSAGLISLTDLYLSNNNFTEVPYLPNVGRSLSYLMFTNNRATYLSPQQMVNFKVMTQLMINYNSISGGVPDIRYIPTITSAKFKGNQITELDVEIFSGFDHQVVVYLDDNQISRVSGNFLLGNRTQLSNVQLYLRTNPIACDCKAKWLKLAQMENSPVIQTATCMTPSDKENQALSNVDITNMGCGECIYYY